MDIAQQDLTDVWHVARQRVAGEVPETRRRWLELTEPVGVSGDVVVVAAPHAFARDWLDVELGERLRAEVADVAARPVQVVVVTQTEPTHATNGSMPAPASHGATTRVEPSGAAPMIVLPDEPAVWDGRADDDLRSPGVQAPGLQAPGPQAPGLQAPGLQAPGLQAPGLQAPGLQAPGLQAPGRPAGPTANLPPQRPPPRAGDEGPSRLNPKYLFENFVVGSSNRLARAAAFAVAEAPAHAYNPLFIYGESGLGKTHLLHAVGHYVRTLFPRMRVCYITTEQFTNEFISAIQSRETSAFHGRYRQMDVLLIDDIQFLERAERTQEEFFHTFNHLHGAEKQIVICSDRPPSKLAQLDSRLRSRFEWGLLTDVQPPELETRIAILRKQVEREGLDIQRDVLEYIAGRVSSNIRALEGALLRVTAYASLHGRGEISLDVATSVLKDVLPADTERRITCPMIMEIVAGYFDLTVDDLKSRSRSKHLVIARHIAMYLVREMTDLSLPKIGSEFGGRDHTTVINAKDKIALKIKEDQSLFDQVTVLEQRIKGQP